MTSALPELSSLMTGGQTFNSAALLGAPYVLYFYPKDNTPGCTQQGADFRDHYPAFMAAGYRVFGVSRDSLKSHENFKAKMAFPFELIADTEESLCQAMAVIKQKKMYGKDVRGIERSTFVIDPHGHVVKEWRGVKVANHVAEVLDFIQNL